MGPITARGVLLSGPVGLRIMGPITIRAYRFKDNGAYYCKGLHQAGPISFTGSDLQQIGYPNQVLSAQGRKLSRRSHRATEAFVSSQG